MSALLCAAAAPTADDFFASLRNAFAENERSVGAFGNAVGALAGLALLYVLVRPLIKRWEAQRTERAAFRRIIATRRLSSADVELVESLALHAGTSPLLVTTHIDVFERATASMLRGRPPVMRIKDGDVYTQTASLRKTLGFAASPIHLPLLTTREMAQGHLVDIAGVRTTVDEVTEAFFAATVANAPDDPVGTKIPLVLIHGSEGKYSVACALLGTEPADSGVRLFLGHDEQPARVQLRRFVRVFASEPISLAYEPQGTPRTALNGHLTDISLGGACLDTPEKIPVRTLAAASFEFAGETFTKLPVVVLDCFGPPAGPHRVRFAFQQLKGPDESRLARAIAQSTTTLSGHPLPDRLSLPPAGPR